MTKTSGQCDGCGQMAVKEKFSQCFMLCWGHFECLLYAIEKWSLFRGCLNKQVGVVCIRTWIFGHYIIDGRYLGVVVQQVSTIVV